MRPTLPALVLLGTAAGLARAQTLPTTLPAPVPTTSPAMEPTRIDAAISHLTADDFTERHAAARELQAAIAEQIRHFSLLSDPEARARAGSALRFQQGLSAWAMQLAKLPDARRHSLLAWGLQPDVAPILAAIFTGGNDQIPALHKLGQIKGNQATDMLAVLAEMCDPQTALPALDALWDRQPTPLALEVLWGCLAAQLVPGVTPEAVPEEAPPQPDHKPASHFAREPDPLPEYDISVEAAQTLAHWKHPSTLAAFKLRLPALVQQAGAANGNMEDYESPTPRRDVFLALALGFKTREALPLVAALALGERTMTNDGTVGDNVPVFQSNRTGMLGVWAELTGQKPSDYNLFRCPEFGENDPCNWVVHTQKQEEEAVAKARKWWNENKGKLGFAGDPTSAPARQNRGPNSQKLT